MTDRINDFALRAAALATERIEAPPRPISELVETTQALAVSLDALTLSPAERRDLALLIAARALLVAAAL